jgi:2-phosphoglycolate phosphatase
MAKRESVNGARAVLFDFDGTLADTAGDLSRPLNKMRAARGLPAMPIEALRPFASAGARGLLGAGLGIRPEDTGFKAAREEFLRHYMDEICVDTKLFPGMEELLVALEGRGVRWGIVTNKSTNLTRLIVDALGLAQRAACVVCGDTTAHLKPNPASLLHAAKELALPPQECVYLGDDQRDIIAARAAGMRPVAVEWGYGTDLKAWEADAVISRPLDLVSQL